MTHGWCHGWGGGLLHTVLLPVGAQRKGDLHTKLFLPLAKYIGLAKSSVRVR